MAAPQHDRLISDLRKAGWIIGERSHVFTGPNPTLLHIRRGKRRLHLLVYAWRITGEGKGRSRTDLRVQVTRSHDGPLQTRPGYLTCGIGFYEDDGVFGAFDPWVKRHAGHSSSVHFPRTLLREASQKGTSSRALAQHGPQFCFRPDAISAFLDWAINLRQRRALKLSIPEEHFVRQGDTARIRCERVSRPWADWLRSGDHVVAVRPGAMGDLMDDSVWTIDRIEFVEDNAPRGQGRFEVDCRRHGVIRDADWLKALPA